MAEMIYTEINPNEIEKNTAGLELAAAGQSVSYYGGNNTTNLYLHVWDATAGVTAMQASEWTADGGIIIGFSYRAA